MLKKRGGLTKLIQWENRSPAQFFSSTDRFNMSLIDNGCVIVITHLRDRG